MITHISTVQINVRDQDKALEFYTTKLGFEKVMDEPMGPDMRWVQLAPGKGSQTGLVLFKPAPGMPAYEKAVESIGGYATFIFNVEDMEATCRDLVAKGVELVDQPSKQPWGWWASIKDLDGNIIGLHSM